MKTSAGLLMFRRGRARTRSRSCSHIRAGPSFATRTTAPGPSPKVSSSADEEALACARREFREETGIEPGDAVLIALGEVRQKGGKRVLAWAFEAPPGELDLTTLPAEQHVRARVAPEERQASELSGGRQARVLHAGGGQRKDPRGADRVPGQTAEVALARSADRQPDGSGLQVALAQVRFEVPRVERLAGRALQDLVAR